MIPKSELIINPDGSIYHLNLKPEDIASKIIFVGDPQRVQKVSKHFDSIEVEKSKREFVTVTGNLQGQRLTVLSTGIGTGNIDIVWNELDALVNVDLESRKRKDSHQVLKVLRMGTSGGMQAHLPPGKLVHSRYALGGDGLLFFYQNQQQDSRSDQLQKNFDHFQQEQLNLHFPFYAGVCADSLHQLMEQQFPEVMAGITYTASGFYGPQGRDLLKASPQVADFPRKLATFQHEAYRILNMEMETSCILGLAQLLGHEAGSLSVILANRQAGQFSDKPYELEAQLIQKGLEIMLAW